MNSLKTPRIAALETIANEMGLASPPPVLDRASGSTSIPRAKAVRRASALDPLGRRD